MAPALAFVLQPNAALLRGEDSLSFMRGFILTEIDGAVMGSIIVRRRIVNSSMVHSVMRTRFLPEPLQLVLLDLPLATYRMAELGSMIALLLEVSY